MKKFINKPENVVTEMLEGLLAAHPDLLKSVDNVKNLVRKDAPVQNKVGIVSGGGSGHLPLFLGYIGKGMLDGVAVGEIFASPSSKQILDVTKSVDSGKGVLYLYGNYGGDVMNFDMAGEMAEMEGIRTATVIGTDDVASMPKGQESQRRGVAGLFYLYKIAAAKAEEGATLEEVAEIAKFANENVRTMGVALSPCTLPEVGKPTFTIEDGKMELGMGIHGEPGYYKGDIQTADEVAETLAEKIYDDLSLEDGCEVSVLVNGLGATPLEELYIVFRKVKNIFEEKNIAINKVYIGEYATSLEMAGLSISVLKLNDELKSLLNSPFVTPFHVQP
ncbi:dihydroxyacetone kinase subunit DhaK [Bacillus sp. NTK034]|uniref:dihydroxyacetone kinase subunit DhaK n=1 Tax=Bacillus sp. NTK034 TaxID=2802176 RepID=UPI001A8EEBBC|nr:dihydroxyacetone kinase subunit DhaK [Bacillus sp. NTK034]MBN8201469.1 dihydroxyacetone kinase subunit DhaK [Bacillus sp. NTK034]